MQGHQPDLFDIVDPASDRRSLLFIVDEFDIRLELDRDSMGCILESPPDIIDLLDRPDMTDLLSSDIDVKPKKIPIISSRDNLLQDL